MGIAVSGTLPPTRHDYPDLTVTLHPFLCSLAAGEIKINEHAAVVWLPPEQLHELDWAGADLPVMDAYCRHLEEVKA